MGGVPCPRPPTAEKRRAEDPRPGCRVTMTGGQFRQADAGALNHPNTPRFGIQDSGRRAIGWSSSTEGTCHCASDAARCLWTLPIAQSAEALEAATLESPGFAGERHGARRRNGEGPRLRSPGRAGGIDQHSATDARTRRRSRPALTAAEACFRAPHVSRRRSQRAACDARRHRSMGACSSRLAGRQLFRATRRWRRCDGAARRSMDGAEASTPSIRQHGTLSRGRSQGPLRDIGRREFSLAAPRATAAPRAGFGRRLAVTIAVATGVLLAVAAVASRLTRVPALPARLLEISTGLPGAFALAPDGSAFAYLSGGHLYLQTFGSLEPQDFGEAPQAPNQVVLWSPDGKWIAYSAEGLLRRVPASGGSPFVICSIPATGNLMSAAWLTTERSCSPWREHLSTSRGNRHAGAPARNQSRDRGGLSLCRAASRWPSADCAPSPRGGHHRLQDLRRHQAQNLHGRTVP